MAEAIEGLLHDPGKRQRLEAAAQNRVERDFDWDVIARSRVKLYREMLLSDKSKTA
jgi:glycosyltransferase involved in cell wall biosynthesis